MQCPRCQHEISPRAKFCEECSAPLARPCANCGTQLSPTAKFCPECAHPAGPSSGAEQRPRFLAPEPYTPKHLAEKILKGRSALEGERRHVTVLFADLAGFASLAEQLDPEELHDIIDRCFRLITAEVHRFEGTINQYTGDGVMALFGAPIAHDDGPRRAVHAALAVQRALGELSREVESQLGRPLQMRVGVNTGPVVIGKIGDDLRMDYTAVGDTTNVAFRLQQNASPGSVLVSEATGRLVVGYFDTRDLGTLVVKGHTPVKAFEVLRARGRKASLDVAAERGLTPLVGRERELATLQELFEKVKRGHGQVVCLAGEAGIGKSRVVLEFRRALAERGEDAAWLEGSCVSFGQSIALLPVVDQIRENFAIAEFDGEPDIIAKIEYRMRRLGQLEEHSPGIRYLLSVEPGNPAFVAMEPSARRKKVFDAVLAMSIRESTFRPMVFVFEDLHWIDTSTEEYLRQFMDSLANARVMLILTYRLGYAPPWGHRTFQTVLPLDTLSEPEMLVMAGRVIGAEQFPVELQDALMAKAEGVPLFVEEVTKTLLDLGVLRHENGRYRPVQSIADVSIPETIQDIIMARLDRLGENGKRTVQLASVIGRQFGRRLLESIAGITSELEGLLRQLKALELIYERSTFPEPIYVFKHALIQDVAYQSLLIQRRKQLHRAVGQAIEELYSDRLAEHYEELAHHFTQGEGWGKAVEYSLLAGHRAQHSFANEEARVHYARALNAARKLTPAVDARLLAGLHEGHAAVLVVLAQYETAIAEYERALDLVRDVGDRSGEASILAALCLAHHRNHHPESGIDCNERALAIARELSDRTVEANCLLNRANLHAIWYGGVDEAIKDADSALHLVRGMDDRRLLVEAVTMLGQVRQFRGDVRHSLVHLKEGAELAEAEHLPLGRAMFFGVIAQAALGEYEEALRWYRRLHDYAFGADDKFWAARTPNLAGGIHLELFNLDEAVRLNLEAHEVARKLWRWSEPRGHCLLKVGVAHLERADLGSAAAFFDRAWALLDEDAFLRWRWHIPLLRARGELALAEGRFDDAWNFATQSLDMATRTSSRKHVARAQRLQGEILAATGRLEAAQEPLGASVALAESLGTPREVWVGKAALGRVFARLGRDKDAEDSLVEAAQTIETIAGKLTTPSLRLSFLRAEPVVDVYRTLGRRPPLP
ncbi:MAG: AAA family ATPase [Gammaproteobacteria bacterium]